MTPANDSSQIRFRRPLLKLSGEMLGGSDGFGFNRAVLDGFSREIKSLTEAGIMPGIVLGGGNFFRGARSTLPALKRHRADAIGMLATVMNAICFGEHLKAAGVKAKVYSAVPMHPLVTAYDIDDAVANLNAGVACLYAGGTGHPYFSTDSAAALRAIETGCDVLIKGTKVDGVYDSDPVKNPTATKFLKITYEEVLRRNLGVMDLVAITLCRDNHLPLKILSLSEPGNLLKACSGADTGTDVIES